jgi:hypothetical protein
MQGFAASILALCLAATPAMARAAAGDGTNNAAGTTTTTASKDGTTTDKSPDKSAATNAPKADTAAPAAASNMENELQQLRDLLIAQSKELEATRQEMQQQQQRMEALENELKAEIPSRATAGESVSEPTTEPVAMNPAVPPASTTIHNTTTGASAGTTVAGNTDAGASGSQGGNDGPASISFKGITLTPGGFLAAETVFRNKAIGADINTPFNSVPFAGNSGSQTTEFNATARQSRISLLAEGRLAGAKLSGYYESDFLGAGITSNNNESNSYVLRVRQAWGQAKFDNGWSFTGGQMWSLVTETKKGVDNRTEATPLVIDSQYNVGFSWARQYGFRVAKSFDDDKLTMAFAVENANTTITAHGQNNNFLLGSFGASSGLYNPTANYAFNKTPDFVFKAALDPGWGHYEIFGVVSSFRDRVFPCYYAVPANPGATPPVAAVPCTINNSTNPGSAAFNNSSVGGGIGVNARAPLGKHFDVGFHFLGGDGIGRYGTAGLPDATVRPDGTLALIRSYQSLASLEFHATPKLDIYAYVGGEYAGRTAYLNNGKGEGFGSPLFANYGCGTETQPGAAVSTPTGVGGSAGYIPGSLTGCTGDPRNVLEGTLGFWYKFYKGPKGTFQWGAQYSYVDKNTWYGVADGTVSGVAVTSNGQPHALDNMVFTSFRYYLP